MLIGGNYRSVGNVTGRFGGDEVIMDDIEIRVTFKGGPLDDDVAYVNRLDSTLRFIDSERKTIHVYARENEILYFYDPIKSMYATVDYERIKSEMNAAEPPSIRFLPVISQSENLHNP